MNSHCLLFRLRLSRLFHPCTPLQCATLCPDTGDGNSRSRALSRALMLSQVGNVTPSSSLSVGAYGYQGEEAGC